MNITIKSVTEPECKTFLKIKKDGVYYTIDEFIAEYHSDSDEVMNDCAVWYRGIEKGHQQMTDDYVAFSESLDFYIFQEPMLVIDESIRASVYFTKKAKECLEFARFFTMNSALLLDTNYNLHWAQGYIPQYLFRCIYFGTASTWYSNSFDHILQIVYWGLKLYTSAIDRDGKAYDDAWDAKKSMALCTYEFVVGELKVRGLTDIRKYLTSCSGRIEEVRMWANYIKHKGGIDYKYLEADKPFKFYMTPIQDGEPLLTEPKFGDKMTLPDERFALDDFKSPVEVDIDEKLSKLKETHIAIHQCLSEIVTTIDFNKHSLQFTHKEDNPNE